MKILIIGLGSMGKRRVRNLQTLSVAEIIAFDQSEERRREAELKYGIKTFGSFQEAIGQNPDALVISTPPNVHNEYIKLAIENKKPAFVEASVIIEGLIELADLAKKNNVFIAPSCTFRFHPAIKEIKKIVDSEKYGKVANFIYYLGQYLPDWHPSEDIRNFYVGKRETGGGREMVPFELTWIVDMFGLPKSITGFAGKTLDMKVDIDDTYSFSMDFGNKYGSVLIDVVARYAIRSLILNTQKAQITWRWDEDFIKIYDADLKKWESIFYQKSKAEAGYNENIGEGMYIDEMQVFVNAVEGKGKFPNTLEEDIKVLELLNKIEEKQNG